MYNVLVVDDSIFIRKILRDTLLKLGVDSVDEASDGMEAVLLTRKKTYNMVFMDIMMPKLDGLEAIKQIKPFCPDTKIIVCTSIEQKKVVQEAVAADADDYIIKPFDFNIVRTVFERYSGIKRDIPDE